MTNDERKHLAKINKHFKAIYYRMREETCNPKNRMYGKYHKDEINSDAWKYFDDFYDDMYEEYLEIAYDVDDCKRIKLGRQYDDGCFCKENCFFYIIYRRMI